MPFRKPMGAKDYEGREHQVRYPCYAQPKVDGIRCVTDGQRFWSKNGKLFPKKNVEHLKIPRLPFLLDGELSLLGGHTDFEEIASVVKRAGHDDSHRICINVFDCMTPEPYIARKLALKGVFERMQLRIISKNWNRLKTEYISDAARLQRVHDYYLACGYEGTIVRNAFGLYVPKKTIDLLKWKPLHDAEFEIVAVKEAKGKDAGTPIFICMSKGGEFRVRPMGTMAQRRKMWRQRRRLIGKLLTVEYQNLTRYGKPRFPRAKVLRDYE